MGAVKRGILAIATALAVLLPALAGAQSVERWRPFIREASLRFGVPEPWIERVMRTESAGKTEMAGRPIVSVAGAMGLMQLMPRTWADMRQRAGLGLDPFDPHDNILAGTLYLRLLYDAFGYPGLFAAYNAGPARYQSYLDGSRPLPGDTVRYSRAVAGTDLGAAAGSLPRVAATSLAGARPRPVLPASSPLFAVAPRGP